MKKLTIAAMGLCLATTLSAPASAERLFADVYSECGIGAMIFNNENTTSANGPTLAIISNVTWDLGTTAHSSNLSSEDQCAGGSMTTAAFIHQNAPMIESDIARGEGEYLYAMVQSMECTAPTEQIVSGLRTDLSSAIASGNRASGRYEQSERLYNSLLRHCTV